MESLRIFITCFHTFIVALSLTFNGVIIRVIRRGKDMKNFMNYLLLNFAILDIFLGCYTMPFILTNEDIIERLPPFWRDLNCKITNGILFVIFSSCFTLAVISIERYIGIYSPTKWRVHATRKNACKIILIIWLASITLTAPYVAFGKFDKETGACVAQILTTHQGVFVTGAITCVFAYLLPNCVLLYTFAKTVHLLWFKESIKNTKIAAIRSRRRIIKLIGAVALVFNICHLPHFIVEIICMSKTKHCFKGVYKYVGMLVVLNSMIDPLLLRYFMPQFRSGFREVFGICRKKDKVKNVLFSSKGRRKVTFNSNHNVPNPPVHTLRSPPN